jgi:ribonuclease Y
MGEIVLFVLAGLIGGLGSGYVIFVAARKKQLEAEQARVLEEARLQGENIKKDRVLEAKEKYMQLRSDYDREINKRNQEMNNAENRLKQKEQSLDDKLKGLKNKEDENDRQRQRLDAQIEAYKKKENEVNALREQQLQQLEKVAGFTAAEAKEQMLETIKAKAHSEGMSLAKNIVEEAKLGAGREAKRIVLQTIQRTAAELACASSLPNSGLPGDSKAMLAMKCGNSLLV